MTISRTDIFRNIHLIVLMWLYRRHDIAYCLSLVIFVWILPDRHRQTRRTCDSNTAEMETWLMDGNIYCSESMLNAKLQVVIKTNKPKCRLSHRRDFSKTWALRTDSATLSSRPTPKSTYLDGCSYNCGSQAWMSLSALSILSVCRHV
jgi:hypothetical protein